MKLLYIGIPFLIWTMSAVGILVCIHLNSDKITGLERFFWCSGITSGLLLGIGVISAEIL